VDGHRHDRQDVRQLERDPPRYLLAEFGGRRQSLMARALWRAAATDVQRYRARHAITDPGSQLA
jgi:hypothetical protein